MWRQHGIWVVNTTIQPGPRGCIRGYESSFAAHLNRHVAESETLAHRHLLDQLSRILDGAIVGAINPYCAHHFKSYILGINTKGKPSQYADIDCWWDKKPGAPGCIGNPDVGRAHARGKGSQRPIGAGVAIGSNDDVTWTNITAFRHHLVANALLQDGNVLLLCKRAHIAVQGGRCDGRRRYDVVKHNMRPLGTEDAPTICQLAKGLDCQGSRRIVAHDVVNVHYDSLALRYSATQLMTKDYFG